MRCYRHTLCKPLTPHPLPLSPDSYRRRGESGERTCTMEVECYAFRMLRHGTPYRDIASDLDDLHIHRAIEHRSIELRF